MHKVLASSERYAQSFIVSALCLISASVATLVNVESTANKLPAPANKLESGIFTSLKANYAATCLIKHIKSN